MTSPGLVERAASHEPDVTKSWTIWASCQPYSSQATKVGRRGVFHIMRISIVAAAALMACSVAAFAQTAPSSNATTLGTESAPGNSSGMPSAATPAGQIATTGMGASPSGTSAFATAGQRAPTPTADSTTTGTTSK